MESEIARSAIATLHPLFTLRYSATHRNPYNLLYELDPIKAYDLRLVKRIEVASIRSDDSFNDATVVLGFDGVPPRVILADCVTPVPDTVAVMLNGTGTPFCTLPDARSSPFSIVTRTSWSGVFFVASPCCSRLVSDAPSIAICEL